MMQKFAIPSIGEFATLPTYQSFCITYPRSWTKAQSLVLFVLCRVRLNLSLHEKSKAQLTSLLGEIFEVLE